VKFRTATNTARSRDESEKCTATPKCVGKYADKYEYPAN
jgi:hypothetical protein